MAKQTSKAVAVKENRNDVPAYLKNHTVDNSDNFDQSDTVMPQIKLLQGTSKECETFEAAKPGVFWHTGFDMSLGTELEFVVASRNKKWLLMAPMEDGRGVLARSDDAKTWDRTGEWEVKIKDERKPVTWTIESINVDSSGVVDWGTHNPNDEESPPAATMFYDYLVLLPNRMDLGPAVISLARSAIKPAKKGLNAKINLHKAAGRPMQSLLFKAQVENDKNDVGQEYKRWVFIPDGFAEEDVFKAASSLKDTMQRFSVRDETSGVEDEERGSASNGAEDSEY